MFEKLDIIIPQYNEDEKKIKPLLTSLENQIGVNLNKYINVTIVNDHSDMKLSEDFLKLFSFPITYLETPQNGGGGDARQWGIDHTSNPLIMFCDADDRFFDCCALINLYNAMKNNNSPMEWKIMYSDFYEEQYSEDGYDLIRHDSPSAIWLHGKVFRRSFLEQYNIRFIPGLRSFEDTYFGNMVALLSAPQEQLHCHYFTYLWCKNPQSVTAQWTREKKDYLYWNYQDYVTCNKSVIDNVYAIDPKNPGLPQTILIDIFFSFFVCQLKEFEPTEQDDIQEIIKRRNSYVNFIYYLINTYIDLIKLPPNKMRMAYWTARKDMYRYGMYHDTMLWNDFIIGSVKAGKIGKDARYLMVNNLLPEKQICYSAAASV